MKRVILLCYLGLSLVVHASQRVEIGASAHIELVDEKMNFLARIDSGARITSLHALNIQLTGPRPLIWLKPSARLEGMPFQKKHKNEEYKRNIGRMISFDTLNEKGELKHIHARVVNVARVRNAQGVEYRYVIRLGLKYKDVVKYKEVNLRDRSNMSYKLLIGRNWLNDDFLIKTDKKLIF